MRVLVAEDFEVLADAIGTGLRREGMAVDVVLDGNEALEHLAVTRYDVIVLDRDLPGVHGDEVCRQLVADRSDTRILMLTAASTVRDRVDGLGLGADDYLPKPFHFPELVLRVRALARRASTAQGHILRAGDIEFEPSTGTVIRNGCTVTLTARERGVLEALLKASPGGLSAEQLLDQVWDENADPFTNTVRVTIGRLRRKLGEPQVIQTTPGIGYRIADSETEPGPQSIA